jgi:hypothetical protein
MKLRATNDYVPPQPPPAQHLVSYLLNGDIFRRLQRLIGMFGQRIEEKFYIQFEVRGF